MTTSCDFTKFWIFERHGGVIGRCLYCGRPFCPEHGFVYEDGQEICARQICQDKHHELPQYQEYRALVQNRNTEQQCGGDGCSETLVKQCSGCQGIFCALHATPRSETFTVGRRSSRRYLSLCGYCWERRKIWNKV